MWSKTLLINGLEVEAKCTQKSIDDVFLPLLSSFISLQKEKNRRIIVFFAAPPASGKSTLLEILPELAKTHLHCEELDCVGMDGFHYYNDVLEEKGLKGEKGSPRTFDVEKLAAYLKKLQEEDTVSFPIYHRPSHNPIEDGVTLTKKIVIVEGNYLCCTHPDWQILKDFCDYSFFLEVEGSALKERLVHRKMQSGSTKEEANAFYEASDGKNVDYVLENRSEVHQTIYLHTPLNEGHYSNEKQL